VGEATGTEISLRVACFSKRLRHQLPITASTFCFDGMGENRLNRRSPVYNFRVSAKMEILLGTPDCVKRTLHSILGLSCLLAVANIAAASTINVSTGQDGLGNIWGSGNQIDTHWTVTGADSETGTNPARTVFPDNADYCNTSHGCAPAWVANDSLSDWIAFNPNATANGTGTYTTTFDLSGANLSTASLSGFWTIDDQGTLTLNGHLIATLPPPSQPWTVLTPFSVSTGSSDFVAGINTLTIQITAADNFEEGARLNGTVSFSANTVPEPSSILLFASGALALAGTRLRRWKTAQSARQ